MDAVDLVVEVLVEVSLKSHFCAEGQVKLYKQEDQPLNPCSSDNANKKKYHQKLTWTHSSPGLVSL
jgi:hypothetical protein